MGRGGWGERDGERGMGGEGWGERGRGMGGEGWGERDGERGMGERDGGEGWGEGDGGRGMGRGGWGEGEVEVVTVTKLLLSLPLSLSLSLSLSLPPEYKITVGHRPISRQLTKLTAQNVTWSVLRFEQVSALILPRETGRSFMGRVWICTCTGVYRTRGAKSVGVALRTRD